MNSPKEIAQNYTAIGTAKTKLPVSKMLVLGILAGMFIAVAGVASTIASATLTDSVGKLIGAAVFPGGLAMVLLAGSELFTGNTIIVLPVCCKQATVGGMLKNWVFVYIGNFIGSLLIAALVVYGGTFGLFDNLAGGAAINTAVAKVTMTFDDAFIRGILCNFLVCIAVWISFAAKDVVGKVAGIFFPIMMFVLLGWEHSIANMYYISAGLLAAGNEAYLAASKYAADISALTWGSFFVKNLLPVTLGNIVGGSVLVGLGYWFIYARDEMKAKADCKQ
ncbi:MAG: formate/nitrite transporter family protein [Clostridiales bacterium]|nr:formate/nitrite transporter family protein [Clostridiales bacterium]